MNTMTHINRLAVAFALSLMMFACSDNKPAPQPSAGKISEVSMPAGEVSVGVKSVFQLKGSGFESPVQNLYCLFDATSAEVWIEGNRVSSGEKYPLAVNNRTFAIECCPLAAGTITVELKVEDGNTVAVKKLTVTAVNKLYDVQLKNIPSPFYIGHRRVVDLSIIDPARPNIQNVKYEVGARVVKGKGVIHIAGEDEPVWCDTIPGYEPFTAEVRNANWMIMYTGMEVGENQLEFTVTDPEKGTSSTSIVSIPVDSSDFALNPRFDSPQTIERNERYHVYIWIDEKGHSANRYFARINPIEGKMSSIFPTAAGEYGPVNASDSYTIFPEGDGPMKCEIEIRDLYGTIRTLPIDFTVKSDDYDILFDAPAELYAFTQKTFEFNITGSSDDQNSYRLRASLESGDPEAVRLLLNAGSILGLPDFTNILPHETLYIDFTKAGTYRFKFEFSDKWSEPKERYLTFTVKENALAADLGTDFQETVLGSLTQTTAAWTARLSVPEPAGDLWKGATVKSDLIQGKGELRVNGSVIESGDILTIARNECSLTFTPSATGTHTLAFLFSLADGRTVTKTATVRAAYSPIALNLVCPSGPLYEEQEREISISASQPGYGSDLQYRFEFVSGSGKIVGTDGSDRMPGTIYPVVQGETERMTYTADGYIGPIRIRYTVIGGDAMTTEHTAQFTVEPGLNMSLSAPTQIRMGSTANITVSVNKPGYNGSFKIRYNQQQPYPSYTGSGTIAGMSEGNDKVLAGNTETLQFTPTSTGQMQLQFTVTDETGKSVSKVVLMKIDLLPLEVSPSPLEVYRNKTTAFTLTIPADNPAGDYRVSYVVTGDEAGLYPRNEDNGYTHYYLYIDEDPMIWHHAESKDFNRNKAYTIWWESQTAASEDYIHFTLVDQNGVTATTKLRVVHHE